MCPYVHIFSEHDTVSMIALWPYDKSKWQLNPLTINFVTKFTGHTKDHGHLGYSFINKPSRVLEKGGYKCERSSTKIQPFLLFFSHLFLVVFSPVSAFSTFPFLHSWGRWFEVPEPVQKKCLRISLVLQFNSPRSHCSSTIAKLFIFIWQNFTFKNAKQISGS